MADIRKRKGILGDTYQVRYLKPDGKYGFKSFDLRREATAFVETLSGRKFLNEKIKSIDQAVNVWLDVCESEGRHGREPVSKATLQGYKCRAAMITAFDWKKDIQEIEKADIIRFRSHLLKNFSRDQARKTLSSLHSIIIEMIDREHMGKDPAANVTIRGENASLDIPSIKEVKQMLHAADRLAVHKNAWIKNCWERYRPMIWLAAGSGMRPQEYIALPHGNIKAEGILVDQALKADGKIGPPKTSAGRRLIYVGDEAMGLLKAYTTSHPGEAKELVFGTDSGKPMSVTNFRRRGWVPMMEEAGLMLEGVIDGEDALSPKYSPYCLRHFFASMLIASKADLKHIQEQMGHQNIQTTLDVYGHLIKDNQASRAAETRAILGKILH